MTRSGRLRPVLHATQVFFNFIEFWSFVFNILKKLLSINTQIQILGYSFKSLIEINSRVPHSLGEFFRENLSKKILIEIEVKILIQIGIKMRDRNFPEITDFNSRDFFRRTKLDPDFRDFSIFAKLS